MKQILRFLAIALIAAVPLIPSRVYAASATLSLSPASSSVSQNSTLTLTVRMNSDEAVNAVQANLNYPANLLDFVSISSSSAFNVVAQNSGGGGSVKIGRGAIPAVSGSQTVATVRFKAKTSSGSAAISFADGSQVVSANSNNNIMTGSSGGNYTFKPPAAAAPAAPTDTTPPTITNVASSEIMTNSAIITWTTSEPSTSEINYGLNKEYGLTAVDNNLVTDHKITLSSALLVAGTKYHFSVKSVDAAGNAASSQDSTFNTKGATLRAKVENQRDKPVEGAKVTFGEKSGITGKDGIVTLNNLPLGKQVGVIEHRGKKTVAEINIASIDPSGKPHSATFKIETKPSIWLLIIPLAALAALAVWLIKKRGGGIGGGQIGKFLNRLKLGRRTPPTTTTQSDTIVIRPKINLLP